MPGPALLPPRLAALLWAPLIVLAPAATAPAATVGPGPVNVGPVDAAALGGAPVGSVTVGAVTAPARASPVGTADGPAEVALAIGVTTAAAAATGLWLRSRYRREDPDSVERTDGGDP